VRFHTVQRPAAREPDVTQRLFICRSFSSERWLELFLFSFLKMRKVLEMEKRRLRKGFLGLKNALS